MAPPSPRPGGQSSARPTSELLGSGAMYQTPEAEALDQWFENLQNYEATLVCKYMPAEYPTTLTICVGRHGCGLFGRQF